MHQTLLRGGRLLHQYIVDAYTCIEGERLQWYRKNQAIIKVELYNGFLDAIVAGDTSASAIGKRIILSPTFVGGARYMNQNNQDAIAIYRWAGPPDLFITFTFNPKWNEITKFLELYPSLKPEDRPDIVARVFKIKVDRLMEDLEKGQRFGRVIAALYVIEFQKRGLPHAHILLFLHPDDKPRTMEDIDKIISAELPSEKEDPILFKIVMESMIHGPCGKHNMKCPCMVEENCLKFFPKEICNQTFFDEEGFANYKRTLTNTTTKKGVQIDSTWVVPHNPALLKEYNAHINVKFRNKSRMIKYLFKYISKGQDRGTAVIEENLNHIVPQGA